MQKQLKTIGSYKYLSTDKLGEGSYGEVYKCKHSETQEEFAIKVIPKTKLTKSQELMNEIEILTRLKSPYIVQLHSILESTNNYYLVLDLCECDLLSIMKKKKIFSEDEAISIMVDVAKGFLELIEHGIIHRDLKPANILFSKGTYKIADFGFSRTVDDLSNQKFASQIGTPMYMSLQILKNNIQPNVIFGHLDSYSMNYSMEEVIIYQIKAPWIGTSELGLRTNIEEKELVFYDQINPVSNKLKKLLESCLQKEEKDRISWIVLFRHIIFEQHFQQFYNLELKCNKLEKFLATNLRIQIAKQNLDIDKIIQHHQCGQTINSKQFYQILYSISQNISRLEVQQIYDNIKTEAHLDITIDQFKQWLEQFEILTNSQYAKSKQNQCLQELNYVMKINNSTLQQFYNKFNKDKDGKLKFIEFKQILCLMNDKLTEQQIQESFCLIDETKKGYITINQFQKVLNVYQK